jgi:hypothetical protein
MNKPIAFIATAVTTAILTAGCAVGGKATSELPQPGPAITQAPDQPQLHPQRGPACRLPRCPQ